ncbi:hypothetical protein BDR26DRAFT_857129, partial [Obelidium mucronatum]
MDDFSGQLKLMASMGLTDVAKNRLALQRSGGRVQLAIDWVTTDSIPAEGVDSESLAAYVRGKEAPQQTNDGERRQLNALKSMGFADESLNRRALRESLYDTDKAVEWLINKTGDADVKELFKAAKSSPVPARSRMNTAGSTSSPSGSYVNSNSYKSPTSSSATTSPTKPSNSTSNKSSSSSSNNNTYSANLIDTAFTVPSHTYVPQQLQHQVSALSSSFENKLQVHDYSASPREHQNSYLSKQLPPQAAAFSTSPASSYQHQPVVRTVNPFQSVGPVDVAQAARSKKVDENKFLSIEDLKRMGMLEGGGSGSGGGVGGGSGHGASGLSGGWAQKASSNGNRNNQSQEDDADPFADPFA